MAVKPDGAPSVDRDVAAQRRWLITLAITIVFGGFGAVMAYLSYANSSKSTGKSRSSGTSPGTSPGTAPAVPPAVVPSSDNDDQGKRDKPDKDK